MATEYQTFIQLLQEHNEIGNKMQKHKEQIARYEKKQRGILYKLMTDLSGRTLLDSKIQTVQDCIQFHENNTFKALNSPPSSSPPSSSSPKEGEKKKTPAPKKAAEKKETTTAAETATAKKSLKSTATAKNNNNNNNNNNNKSSSKSESEEESDDEVKKLTAMHHVFLKEKTLPVAPLSKEDIEWIARKVDLKTVDELCKKRPHLKAQKEFVTTMYNKLKVLDKKKRKAILSEDAISSNKKAKTA